jgi:hypothetical protein
MDGPPDEVSNLAQTPVLESCSFIYNGTVPKFEEVDFAVSELNLRLTLMTLKIRMMVSNALRADSEIYDHSACSGTYGVRSAVLAASLSPDSSSLSEWR